MAPTANERVPDLETSLRRAADVVEAFADGTSLFERVAFTPAMDAVVNERVVQDAANDAFEVLNASRALVRKPPVSRSMAVTLFAGAVVAGRAQKGEPITAIAPHIADRISALASMELDGSFPMDPSEVAADLEILGDYLGQPELHVNGSKLDPRLRPSQTTGRPSPEVTTSAPAAMTSVKGQRSDKDEVSTATKLVVAGALTAGLAATIGVGAYAVNRIDYYDESPAMTISQTQGATGAPAWTGLAQVDSTHTQGRPATATVRITYDQGTFSAQVGAMPKDTKTGKTVVKGVEIKAGGVVVPIVNAANDRYSATAEVSASQLEGQDVEVLAKGKNGKWESVATGKVEAPSAPNLSPLTGWVSPRRPLLNFANDERGTISLRD